MIGRGGRRSAARRREQGRRAAQEARRPGVGWRAEQAASLLERLGVVTQLLAASIDAGGNFPLLTQVWGPIRGTDAPSLLAGEFGTLCGELQAAAAWWGLPMDSMAAHEMDMQLQLVEAVRRRGRAEDGPAERARWLADAGELVEATAFVTGAVAATFATGGRFELLRGPFGPDVADKADWLAMTFAHLQVRLRLSAELWELPLDRLSDAELEAIEDVRAERIRA
jgi:hypothetical protein